jgi:hypothetical protein
MYQLMVFVVLALGLAVISDVIAEVVPFTVPSALKHTVSLLIAMGVAWLLDYSVFQAFGQTLRSDWQDPVFTGIALVGGAELIRNLASSLGVNLTIGGGGRAATS